MKTGRAKARKKEIKVPYILTYTRKIEPTLALLYGTDWKERHNRKAEPLRLQQKHARITGSNADQRFDVCFLPPDCDTLLLDFGLIFLAGVDVPCECSEPDFEDAYMKLIEDYINEYGFHELASRYAQNIANGRTLWRSRIDADAIEVIVQANDKSWSFDAHDFSIRNFNNVDSVSELADMIANALSGEIEHLAVKVKIYARIGNGCRVYPSVEKFSEGTRILYEFNGVAAVHSQKIGNAIRTIDTWYPAHETDEGIGPIPVEVYGITINPYRVFRPSHESDFYTIFDQAVADGCFKNAEEAHYAVAVLIRGGNFGTKQMS